MDNQQLSKLTEIELAWFAGFIDGEGCISIRTDRDSRKIRRLVSSFEICNTQKELIDKCFEIANKIGVTLRIRNRVDSKVKKPIWKADTHRHAKVKKLIEPLIPYIVGKKQRAEIVVEFINTRINRCIEAGKGSKVPYSDYEIELAGKIKELNGRGSSETIRMALTT